MTPEDDDGKTERFSLNPVALFLVDLGLQYVQGFDMENTNGTTEPEHSGSGRSLCLAIQGVKDVEDFGELAAVIERGLVDAGHEKCRVENLEVERSPSLLPLSEDPKRAPGSFWPILKIERLARLHRDGHLTVPEFIKGKTALLKVL